ALPTVLARNAAEMQDAVAAGHHALDRRHVGEVGTVDLLALARRREPHPVAEPQQRIDPAQALAQGAADAAGRAGDQDPMHAECFPIASALRNPNSSERPRRHTRTPARAADGCGRNRDRGKATGPPPCGAAPVRGAPKAQLCQRNACCLRCEPWLSLMLTSPGPGKFISSSSAPRTSFGSST